MSVLELFSCLNGQYMSLIVIHLYHIRFFHIFDAGSFFVQNDTKTDTNRHTPRGYTIFGGFSGGNSWEYGWGDGNAETGRNEQRAVLFNVDR